MIAALPQTQSRQSRTLSCALQTHRSLPFGERMSRQYWSVASRRRVLTNIVTCFSEQPMMWPLQCTAAVEQLIEVRKYVCLMETMLSTLEPATTQRIRPYACICKLTDLTAQLTEVILSLKMFEPICQSVCFQRISLHIALQVSLRRLSATYQDTVSQLDALISHEREEAVHDLK